MYLHTQINPWIYVIMRKESVRRCFLWFRYAGGVFAREKTTRHKKMTTIQDFFSEKPNLEDAWNDDDLDDLIEC